MLENTFKPRSAALIYGPYYHYIDHLAPLSCILEIPLLVTQEDVAETIRLFYPQAKVFYLNYIEMPQALVSHFDQVFVCTPRITFDECFLLMQTLYQKKIKTIWCPHGNSDKGHSSFHMEALQNEENLLVYGDKMVDFLHQKGVCQKNLVRTSNFRKEFYEEEKTLAQRLISDHLPQLFPQNKILLYAPTWEDAEGSSSFSSILPYLVEKIPPGWTLLVKPHPNLLTQETHRELVDSYRHQKNLFFLENFPPIYPLLSVVDIYLGDFSSIGYDFLSFDRPLYFLNPRQKALEDPGLFLHRCGIQIQPHEYDQIYTKILDTLQEDFYAIRADVYQYTFGKKKPLLELKQEIADTFLYG